MSDHNLVLKNTMMLYLRMFITLALSLFTTRIVFNALGVSDLGIYNVVGGVLSLLGILNNTMASSAQRFISYELAENNIIKLKRTFGTLLLTQFVLCLVIIIIAESVGLWFVNNKLVIPQEKIDAANWIFQTAVVSMVLGIIKSPFTASIIAHERMSIYAYFSIIDVIIKLLIVIALLYISRNKLIVYALLLLFSVIIDFTITIIFCLRNFNECSFHLTYDKRRFKEIFSFSGWTLIGQSTIITNEQVVNIFINWFFGTIANGARDIAVRINGMVSQFIFQFQMAINPPIIKSYAAGDYVDMKFLLNMGCKVSFMLMFLLSFPIIMETPLIFRIWLGAIPEYSVWFLRLILFNTLMDSMTGPITKSIQATGTIRKEQISVSSILILVMPLSYLILWLGCEPYFVYVITIIMGIITLFIRVYILSQLVPIVSLKEFILKTFGPCMLGAFLALLIMLLIKYVQQSDVMLVSLSNGVLCLLVAAGSFYFFTLNNLERTYVFKMLGKLKHKLFR